MQIILRQCKIIALKYFLPLHLGIDEQSVFWHFKQIYENDSGPYSCFVRLYR
jgi:hypothetical protein